MKNRQAIITVEHVTKNYVLRKGNNNIKNFVSDLFGNITDVLINGTIKQEGKEIFTALNDVSFTIRKGESVGIVGRNGSGKSTLLRILAGMTESTEGQVRVEGKFAALFALNAGFNMDLSGMKNIYLSCAIQGLSREETDAIAKDIIDFSEIGHFIDQPVRTYSTGMRARLGFSIIFHTLPSLVFIDEALSTGDIAFQQKCLDRLSKINEEEDQTIIFISHSISEVQDLCKRVIWIHNSQLMMDGSTEDVLPKYQSFMENKEVN